MTKNKKDIIVNAFTLDVEDYWSTFLRYWFNKDTEPSEAVVRNTEWFLGMLAEFNVKATCFILGEVAVKYPSLIKKISNNGHEVASHGFSHNQIFNLSQDQFRQEISDSKKLLEDITSAPIVGYRAPAFSVMPQTQWALEVLAEEGYKYDSSVFPISGKRYGWPGFSQDICKVDLPSGKSIVEVPMSTVSLLEKTLPAAGGGYLRHFPYIVTKTAIKQIQKARPAIVYMHPYEIDIENKKLDFSSMSFVQKYRTIKFHLLQLRNRKTVAGKLIKLLDEFEFTTISEIIDKSFEK
jgi:polysaccharide deacetylase family protein (PEP-CTERM system associated)